MTALWQPLTTAEEVVLAHEAGQRIEYKAGKKYARWALARCTARYDGDVIWAGFATGGQYRALVEGGEGGAE